MDGNDIAILEEPEHLNWYNYGKRWNDKFNRVVGVVHTNYLEYIKTEKNKALQVFLVIFRLQEHNATRFFTFMLLPKIYPKSVISNVNDVNPKFMKIGEKVAEEDFIQNNQHMQLQIVIDKAFEERVLNVKSRGKKKVPGTYREHLFLHAKSSSTKMNFLEPTENSLMSHQEVSG